MNKKNIGRPLGTFKKDSEKVKAHTFKVTDNEYFNYLKRGGAKWLRPLLRDENQSS